MKTITYNPETHRLVPVEPNNTALDWVDPGFGTRKEAWERILASFPQPEPVEVEPVATDLAFDSFIKVPNDIYSAAVKLNRWSAENNLKQWSICGIGQSNTAPPDYEEIKRQRDDLVKALEWQPIETAPKDGQAFDVWVMSTKNKSYGVRMTNVYYNNGVICGMRYPDASFGEYASHWMPLPAAPALASVKGGV